MFGQKRKVSASLRHVLSLSAGQPQQQPQQVLMKTRKEKRTWDEELP